MALRRRPGVVAVEALAAPDGDLLVGNELAGPRLEKADLGGGGGAVAGPALELDAEPTAIKFVADGLGVAFMPEQITGLPHEGVVFRPLSPPLRREATIAWRADNPSKPLQDYIQIVKDLSRSM